MNAHPLDPIALIAGLVTLVGGIVALLHQGGAMHLGPAALATIACVTLGLAGAVGVFLANRTPVDQRVSKSTSAGPTQP